MVPPSVIRGMCLKSGVVSCRELDILDDTSKYIAGATQSKLFMELLRNCSAPVSISYINILLLKNLDCVFSQDVVGS